VTEEFFGPWTVEVAQKDAAFSERFVIEGSDASDGAYPGETGTPAVSVTGERWRIRLEWNDNAGSGWQPSAMRRLDVGYTIQQGLVVQVGADDNYEEFRDDDFNDVVLECRSDDPRVNPWHPFANPYDFTLPDDVRERGGRMDPDTRWPPRDRARAPD